jgi:hypothetical protein
MLNDGPARLEIWDGRGGCAFRYMNLIVFYFAKGFSKYDSEEIESN